MSRCCKLWRLFWCLPKGGPARVPTSCHSHVEHSARAVCMIQHHWHSSLVSLIKWISRKEWHLGRTVSPAAFRIQSSWFPQTKVQKFNAWSIEIPRAPVVLAGASTQPFLGRLFLFAQFIESFVRLVFGTVSSWQLNDPWAYPQSNLPASGRPCRQRHPPSCSSRSVRSPGGWDPSKSPNRRGRRHVALAFPTASWQ